MALCQYLLDGIPVLFIQSPTVRGKIVVRPFADPHSRPNNHSTNIREIQHPTRSDVGNTNAMLGADGRERLQ